MLKKIIIGIVAVFLIAQFFRPERNVGGEMAYDVSTKYDLPEDVNLLLESACKDCHSNNTEYPWYASIQPVAMWLNHHVEEGKEHLNFSAFTNAPIAIQNHKFEEVIETIESGEMPMPSYTWMGLHSDARLSDSQKQTIMQWARNQMSYLKANYPTDSLTLRFPGGPPGDEN